MRFLTPEKLKVFEGVNMATRETPPLVENMKAILRLKLKYSCITPISVNGDLEIRFAHLFFHK